jgi:hypothetical protein
MRVEDPIGEDQHQGTGNSAPENLGRRGFFRFAGAVAAGAAAPASALAATQGTARAPQTPATSAQHAYTFFNPEEAAFIEPLPSA